MLNIIYGAAGAVLVLLLISVGVVIGYKLKTHQVEAEAARAPKPETPEEAERRRLIADQIASRLLYNYNADVAYGMVTAKDFETEDGDI